MPVDAQWGMKTEVTVGTALTVDSFYPFEGEDLTPDVGRVQATGRRAGSRGLRADGTIPYVIGASGKVKLPIYSKGFGKYLVHLLGGIATAGPTDAAYTHTATVGALNGKSFTAQANREFEDGTNQAHTWNGCKINSWTLKCDTGEDGKLEIEMDLVGMGETPLTALATASYPTGMEVLSWVRGSLTVGGVSVDMKSWSVTVNNNLDTERTRQRNLTTRKEPLEKGLREVKWEFDMDHTTLVTGYNRVVATTPTGCITPLVALWEAPTLIGATTRPGLRLTLPAARFDEPKNINSDTMDPILSGFSGIALDDPTNGIIKVEYITSDVTP